MWFAIISEEKTQFIIDNYKKFSELVKPNIKLNVVKVDEDDNRILECAETANVGYIISGDGLVCKFMIVTS